MPAAVEQEQEPPRLGLRGRELVYSEGRRVRGGGGQVIDVVPAAASATVKKKGNEEGERAAIGDGVGKEKKGKLERCANGRVDETRAEERWSWRLTK